MKQIFPHENFIEIIDDVNLKYLKLRLFDLTKFIF